MPFLEGLQNNQSLESLYIHWTSTHPDQSLKKMGGSVAKSSLKKLNTRVVSPSLQTEETVKDWTQSVQVGATDLVQSLEFHQLQHLKLTIQYRYSGVFMYIVKQVMNSVEHSLNACVTLVNSKRQAAFFLLPTI